MPPSQPRIVLVLSGGNALGAYAAGAYEALHARGYTFDLISGASIGAVNGAIIAGNTVDRRVDRLREFWSQAAMGSLTSPLLPTGRVRELYNEANALQTIAMGRPGLFAPRVPGLFSVLPGMPSDVAIFDHRMGALTLERVLDFDLLNSAAVPLIVNAVDLQTGQAVLFDTRKQMVTAEHLLASTAMPPFYPPIEIDGRLLGDAGLIGNLPLDPVLDAPIERDTLCFAVDAFMPNGEALDDLDAVSERAQDILFAAQSQRTLQRCAEVHRLRRTIAEIVRNSSHEDRRKVAPTIGGAVELGELSVVFVAYRAPKHELAAKMLDFSRASIDDRWKTGHADMQRALQKLDAGECSRCRDALALYDATT